MLQTTTSLRMRSPQRVRLSISVSHIEYQEYFSFLYYFFFRQRQETTFRSFGLESVQSCVQRFKFSFFSHPNRSGGGGAAEEKYENRRKILDPSYVRHSFSPSRRFNTGKLNENKFIRTIFGRLNNVIDGIRKL